jgi:hypothetical protein
MSVTLAHPKQQAQSVSPAPQPHAFEAVTVARMFTMCIVAMACTIPPALFRIRRRTSRGDALESGVGIAHAPADKRPCCDYNDAFATQHE